VSLASVVIDPKAAWGEKPVNVAQFERPFKIIVAKM
jgi:hypothetical protein